MGLVYDELKDYICIKKYSAIGELVWCGMSEICLKLKVLAKIDFIVFFTLLGVK